MSHGKSNALSADQALEKLKNGNTLYLISKIGSGDISPRRRLDTSDNGQQPYAIVITCSDSRVIPESIFGAGIGDLFVIRVAGNVMDDHQLGSVEYAASHLGVKGLLPECTAQHRRHRKKPAYPRAGGTRT